MTNNPPDEKKRCELEIITSIIELEAEAAEVMETLVEDSDNVLHFSEKTNITDLREYCVRLVKGYQDLELV